MAAKVSGSGARSRISGKPNQRSKMRADASGEAMEMAATPPRSPQIPPRAHSTALICRSPSVL